jgi:predicted RNA-binding Zn-ribbon protein involved in translation (DUF1610 family)
MEKLHAFIHYNHLWHYWSLAAFSPHRAECRLPPKRSRNRCVGHRNCDHMITTSASAARFPCPHCPYQNIRLGIPSCTHLPVHRSTVDPESFFFKNSISRFYCVTVPAVHNACSRGDLTTVVLAWALSSRNDDQRDGELVGGTQDCTKVLGVGDLIKHQNQQNRLPSARHKTL